MPIASSRTLAKTISRRGVLGTAAALAATPGFADCQIGPPSHEKGRAFGWTWIRSNSIPRMISRYAPMIRHILKRYVRAAWKSAHRLGEPKRSAYGPTRGRGSRCISRQVVKRPHLCLRARRRLAERRGEGLRISGRTLCECRGEFCCSGFHRRRRRAMAISASWRDRCATLSHGPTKTPQLSAAIPAVFYVGGHSSGGHLCGQALVTDWQKDFGLPADLSKADCA